ncbi:MAG: amino acid adenylation domain-containing protein, partial [Candidatus Aminicenantes bacterium]|nr:amino acid adenylation domain-containing protein [Candidatus Aminicenantes bacterium]
DYPKDKTIQQLLEEQTSRTPDHIAIVGTTTVETLRATSLHTTYRQLNEQSNRLAGLLSEKGVLPDSIVAIMMERSIEMIIAIFGILKAGGAYLPIDPDYPQERIDYMLKDSGAKLLVTTYDEEGEKVRRWEGEKVLLEFIIHHSSQFSSHHSSFIIHHSSHLAYLIYTSGSTGKPKGVMINHDSAVNLLFAMQDKYPFTPADTYLLKTSYIFDVSVTELFGWTMGGGRLAILEKNGEKDPQVISEWIEWRHVTHINFVPPMFNAFLDFVTEKNKDRLAGLKYIFLAGEALLPSQVKKFADLNTSIELENIYGPTEGTVYSSRYSLSEWNGIGNVPIGNPLPNIELYILNKYTHLQPLGIPGELYIGGDGVARGYLNNPEITSEKFKIKNYKLKIKNGSGALRADFHHSILYCTGDRCKWLSDGNLEFLGRIDQQVKIRGFRIEPGEIENRLLKHGQIKDVVVLAKEDPTGDKYLAAYFVSGLKIPGLELREYLAKDLPDYMIPSYFVQLEKLPLTPSGKMDRKALSAPKVNEIAAYVAPRNEIEMKLAEIWAGILGRNLSQDRIGIDDNFFR